MRGCNTFSMAKASGRAQCAPYYKNTITYSTSVYYYYKSLSSKSLTITFMWRLPFREMHPGGSLYNVTIIIIVIILITFTSIILITIIVIAIITIIIITIININTITILVVAERINYSVIHMMAGIPTLTGPGALC